MNQPHVAKYHGQQGLPRQLGIPRAGPASHPNQGGSKRYDLFRI
jgi:hypothetical protein